MAYALPVNALSMGIKAPQGRGGNQNPHAGPASGQPGECGGFNYLLIFGHSWAFPRLEIKGAAIASGIGLVAGLVLSFRAVLKEDETAICVSARRDNWRLDRDTMGAILKVGGNRGGGAGQACVGFFPVFPDHLFPGVAMFAAHNIAMQFLALTFTAADGLAVAATSLVGQKQGKKRPDLSLLYGKVTQRIAPC